MPTACLPSPSLSPDYWTRSRKSKTWSIYRSALGICQFSVAPQSPRQAAGGRRQRQLPHSNSNSDSNNQATAQTADWSQPAHPKLQTNAASAKHATTDSEVCQKSHMSLIFHVYHVDRSRRELLFLSPGPSPMSDTHLSSHPANKSRGVYTLKLKHISNIYSVQYVLVRITNNANDG